MTDRASDCGPSIRGTCADAFAPFAASLVGLRISHVWRGYGSALFIEIGKLHPVANRDGSPGHPEGAVSLGVEWSWRIENKTAIQCGSWSEEELWEPAFDAQRDTQITGCELFGTLPEVTISTEGGIRFVSFSTTDGQPQWYLIDRRDGPPRWFSVREGKLHLGDGSANPPPERQLTTTSRRGQWLIETTGSGRKQPRYRRRDGAPEPQKFELDNPTLC